MRIVFGVLGLLITMAIVGMLVKKQMSAGVAPPVPVVQGAPVIAPGATPQQQVDQFKQAAEAALQQPRPMPEEK